MAATVLVFMIVVSIAIISEQYVEIHQVYSRYQQTAEADRRKAANEATSSCIGIVESDLAHCIANQIEAYDKRQATNQDLQAQQNMALWAFFSFIAACAGIGITGLGIYYVRETLAANRLTAEAAVEASKVAKDALIRQEADTRVLQRAYLNVLPDGIETSYNGKVIGLFRIFNAGNLPAREVTCSANIAWYPTKKNDGFAESNPDAESIVLPKSEIPRGTLPLDNGPSILRDEKGYIYVWGRVTYIDGFGTSRWRTFCHRYNCGAAMTGRSIPAKWGRYHNLHNKGD